MMDCQKVKELLPLWIGQDLPDSASAMEVERHLQKCAACEQLRNELQSSLDILQSTSAPTLPNDLAHRSVWPNLTSRMAEWERGRGRERFNGWIPASVMSLAVALMIAVSLPSIRDEFFSDRNDNISSADLFEVNPSFELHNPSNVNRDPESRPAKPRQAFGTPVIFKDQW